MLESLPNGLDSFIGEEGSMISGGQKQRIALARAFYHNRKILVMDESTSALDNETEKKVMDSIYSIDKNITIIMVAHRLSTLNSCYYIYRIHNKTAMLIEEKTKGA